MTNSTTPTRGPYNAAIDMIGRNLPARAGKTAFIDPAGAYTYGQVAERSDRAGAALLDLGLKPGDRIAMAVLDGIDFVTTFLGAIKVGIIPICLNTLFQAADYAYILTDSGARAAVVSDALHPLFAQALAESGWDGALIVSGEPQPGALSLTALMAAAPETVDAYPSQAEDVAFWLYSSGSTGRPKGAPHRQSSPMLAAEMYARDTFGVREDDVLFSAAKLFFAYGIGNALFFPMHAGATAVLYPGRVTPEVVGKLLTAHGVTVFCGVPTLYGALVASPFIPAQADSRLRLCMSAGEALPEEIGKAWLARAGAEIIDGIGSTEMLHIYVSNRPGQVRYGTTGTPVPGYEVKVVGEDGEALGPGGMGELYVRGPTMTTHYWNQPDKTAATFVDGWMKTGDKFLIQDDGSLTHCGRADDMLKVSGIWVSPAEVENALLAHAAVLEAAVIGVTDDAGLVKTKAFVIVNPGFEAGPALAQTLKDFTKSRLALYKYPRSIVFVDQLPKTATGKIRRHVLRDQEAAKTGAMAR
jgi:benzoate-CoA ligase